MRSMKINRSCFQSVLVQSLLVFPVVAAITLAVVGTTLATGTTQAQLPDPNATHSTTASQLLSDPTLTPGKALLMDLEARFAKDVAVRGGKAFADWMADDGVILGNGSAPAKGRDAINRVTNWTAQQYQLTWSPTDALMGPSGDMGYTWGHFEGHSIDVNGFPVVTTGRYMTIWRKQPNGEWKVVLDAGSNEPADAGDCCKLQKP
jgi:ketosteroid isomerase-like protein